MDRMETGKNTERNTFVKALVLTLVAIAVGVAFYYAFRVANGLDPSANSTEALQLNMVEAKEMFREKNDSIQRLTAYIWEDAGFTAVRQADGSAYCLDADGKEPDTGEYQEYLDAVFGEYQNGGTVYNIIVTDSGTFFYTSYSDAGIVGFVSENVINNTKEYETLEIIETWKLFFKTND